MAQFTKKRDMKNLIKIGHWIIFFPTCYLATYLILVTAFFIPLITLPLMIEWNFLELLIFGGGIIGFLYFLVFFLLALFYEKLFEWRPDKLISSLFLAAIFLFAFYNFIISINNRFLGDSEIREIIFSFKGILIILFIIPAYFKLVFLSMIFPFLSKRTYYSSREE